MLDIQVGSPTPKAAPPIEFLTIQLMPLADGLISVSLKSTTFDERELELIDQEIVDGRVQSLDELFGVIRSNVQFVSAGRA